MPLALIPPNSKRRCPFYRIRGHYLGVCVDRTTGTSDKAFAKKILAKCKAEVECGELSGKSEMTFADAALSYVQAGGESRFLRPIVDHFGKDFLLRDISQSALDAAAHAVYPDASPATRNRQFYTPMSAILKHAGIDRKLRRPKGSEGTSRIAWLWPEDAGRLLRAAEEVDPEFGLFLTLLLYTGMRLSEALRLQCGDVRLGEGFVYVRRTKNGQPRPVHLPPVLIARLANEPRKILERNDNVFRFRKNGRLYEFMARTKLRVGADLDWVTFHSLRHTWATWMRRYAGLDTTGLVATGAWTSRESAARYEHAITSEESQRADMLPDVAARRREK